MQISLPTWPSALTTTKLGAKKISGQPDLPWSSCSVPISFSMGDWTAQQASPSTAPDRLPRSPLGRYHPSLQSRTALRQLHSFGPRLPMRSGDGRLTLHSAPSSSLSRPAAILSKRSRSAALFMAATKRRARAICSNKNSLLLGMASFWFDALSHRPMRNARVCYRSGN